MAHIVLYEIKHFSSNTSKWSDTVYNHIHVITLYSYCAMSTTVSFLSICISLNQLLEKHLIKLLVKGDLLCKIKVLRGVWTNVCRQCVHNHLIMIIKKKKSTYSFVLIPINRKQCLRTSLQILAKWSHVAQAPPTTVDGLCY